MTDLPPPRTPAGWYPDGVAGRERRWDGDQWTEQTREAQEGDATPGAPAVTVVRGVTGFAEIDGSFLLYRPRRDRPPLQRIDLHTVERVLFSRRRSAFDVVLVGTRRAVGGRARPSLFSETSLTRNPLTPEPEWEAFLVGLEAAVARAVPKFPPADTRRRSRSLPN